MSARRTTVRTFLLLGFFGWLPHSAFGQSQTEQTPAIGVKPRTVLVRIALDPGVKERSDAEGNIREAMTVASKVYEQDFGISFQVNDVVEWPSNPAIDNIPFLCIKLSYDIAPPPSGIVIGFTSDLAASQNSHLDGLGMPFAPTILIYYDPNATESARAVEIVHEIGHCFGAWHSMDTTSVMYPSATQMKFDFQANSVITLTRDFDFGKDVRQLSDEMQNEITTLFELGHPDTSTNTVGMAYLNLGIAMIHYGKSEDAKPVLLRSATIEPNMEYTYYLLGDIFSKEKQFQSSETYFCKAVHVNPQDVLTHSELVEVLFQQKKYREAWRTAHITERLDANAVPLPLLDKLRAAMPEPVEDPRSEGELCSMSSE